jgi:transposase
MDRDAFDRYVETQLAPTLQRGDIVILDNLSVHKCAQAAKAAIRARGARLLFLPQYSPDLNPIEMAFAKLKAHLRAASARTFETVFSPCATSVPCSRTRSAATSSLPQAMRRIKRKGL